MHSWYSLYQSGTLQVYIYLYILKKISDVYPNRTFVTTDIQREIW